VLNSGIITAKLGTIQLASGDTFTVDLYGDNLMSVQASPALQSQLVQNTGKLKAAGGTIALTAAAAAQTVNSLVNVGGELDAPAIAQKNGSIYIFAEGSNAVENNVAANKGTKTGTSTVNVSGKLNVSSKSGTGGTVNVLGDNVTLASTASIKTNGATGGGNVNIGGTFHGEGTTPTALTTTIEDGAFIDSSATQNGNGGNVAVWSDQQTQMNGTILADGGTQAGNGGFVETSSHGLLGLAGSVDASAPNGLVGSWLLDPVTVTISASGSNSVPSTGGTVNTTGTSYSILNTSISTALSNGNNVTITSGSSGDGYSGTGDITVSGVITATGAGSLTLSAYRDIDITSAITLQGGSLTLQSANSGNSIGAVNIAAAISTSGGNITIGGGSGPITSGTLNATGTVYAAASGYAFGDTQYSTGVTVGGTLNAGAGSIIINGEGSGGTGVQVNSAISATGSGAITINGIGQNSSGGAHGVYVGNTITIANGSISIVGNGGVGSTSTGEYGVFVGNVIKSTGSGNVYVNGTISDTGGGLDTGVYIQANNGITATGTGNIFVVGNGGTAGGYDDGIHVSYGYSITNTGTGNITLTGVYTANSTGIQVDNYSTATVSTSSGNIFVYADSIGLGGTNDFNSGGSLTIAPYTHGSTIGIGPTSGSTDNFSDALIADTRAASYIFGATKAGDGSTTTGLMTVNSAHDFSNANVSFITGNSYIDLAGTLTKATGSSAAAYLFQSNYYIYNANSAGITASNGMINLTLDSVNGANGNTIANGTIAFNNAIINTNGGSITMGGGTSPTTMNAVDGNNGSGSAGVYLSGSTINAAGGTIIINGQGAGPSY
jgi:hypothetical protein